MTRIARRLVSISLVLAGFVFSLSGRAGAQTKLFEVADASDRKVLQVQDDGGFVVTGTPGYGAIPATGAGVRLMWYPRLGAFRAGNVDGNQWDEANIGYESAALGEQTKATGTASTALGSGTTASGYASTSMGIGTTASATYSAAMGYLSIASGGTSTAMGAQTIASGTWSTAAGAGSIASGEAAFAAGHSTTAAGINSVALGTGVTAQGNGSFIFGDRSTGFNVAAAENTFMVRAFGGLGFNTGVNIGCDLPAGSGAWACTSSRYAKEGFEDMDGEAVLRKLSTIPIRRWRYIGNASQHVGPVAEDFYSAFGLGEGPTTITTVDADGINMLAIQSLEHRTLVLREENAALQADLAALRAQVRAILADGGR